MKKISSAVLWNHGAKYGALLGIFTIACFFLSHCSSLLNTSSLKGFLSFIVWVIQFTGCILIVRYAMKNLAGGWSEVTNQTTFRYGLILALLSAVICAAYNLAFYLFISPDSVGAAMDAAYQFYGSMLDSNSRSVLEQTEQNFPHLMFFSTLIYCFLYGLVLSAILSSRIPSKDPFVDFKNEEDGE